MVKQLKNEPAHSFAQYDKFALPAPTTFVTVWKVPANSKRIAFHTKGNFAIDWGDGNIEKIKDRHPDNDNVSELTHHHYDKAGNYKVSITNTITRFFFGEGSVTPKKLIEVKQWGNAQWGSTYQMFDGASSMVCSASDKPDLSKVKTMAYMFYHCRKFNSLIKDWDVSTVEEMDHVLSGAHSFNQPLMMLKAVNDTFCMLEDTPAFDQDLRKLQVDPKAKVDHLFGEDKSLDEYNEEYKAKEERGEFNDVLK